MAVSDVTALLVAWSNGDEAAGTPLMDAVYDELRRLARAQVRRERGPSSLPGTALVHEVYLKLVDQRRVKWQNRAHFFAVASQVMRRLLVDHARARDAQKRGRSVLVPLPDIEPAVEPASLDVIALDRALERLTTLDPRQARLVELRYFGGLTVDEAAEVLAVAPITVKREWALAKTWLYRELRRENA
jgi:RNA polymerase sigma factor (TIGR02999 family)